MLGVILVPVLYVVLQNLREWVKGLFGGKTAAEPPEPIDQRCFC